ncbi:MULTISPECIES: DNA mismatch repair endonuclease MutL [unclassified Leptolyngbya]|uniref:DNA mismatch repair endonuclease MutL n=1 Tax=unclassified Leptolyngbya TaxID=2650499 RepID=UPI001687D973|nr:MULTISPECIES: DNA mismatch repair endonuclease MutL [unclassified Leptolyngbya]MBD1910592.1 DNA mismatch repair endonuclease MutL [Leptolyngbya sp. FACHB-8]MBD2154532.1 DNA mismatch repair endonuclease MutL [Leptolyngbya sp. FACHB-16]
MTAHIYPLPPDLVQRMAAGEVIDSLAAVVRELAENALDAGATRITIALWPEQWRLQLADNGNGMFLEDLQQAALSHRTSKLAQDCDLWDIHSLGFRGEALHSIAQLADLQIGSRAADSPDGWWVTYDHQGDVVETEVAAIAPGTIVRVGNLFADWLPRRQSLPSPAQQLRTIQLTLHYLALCHPTVTWQVYQGDRSWFSLWGTPTPRQLIPQLLPTLTPQDLHEIRYAPPTHPRTASSNPRPISPPSTSIHLTLGLPDRCHRHRPDWVKVAINGRMVRIPELEQTILAAFRRTLPRDRHPVCFAHLHLPPDQIDWNRHPAKAEIYIKALDEWRSHLHNAIQQALSESTAELKETFYTGRISQLVHASEESGSYPSRQVMPPVEGEDTVPASELRAIAQLHQMYIVAEHPTGIWLVEQHIAHERVLYERLCDRWNLMPLDPPLILGQLNPSQIAQLQRLGLDVDTFGEDLWAVRQIPEPLHQRKDCADAILELSLGGDLDTALVATACRTAIRNGAPLTLPEMQTLLNQWQATQNPRTCPHGRPIALQLQESSLSRFFRRHWVIGKSHGI